MSLLGQSRLPKFQKTSVVCSVATHDWDTTHTSTTLFAHGRPDKINRLGKLLNKIREAVADDRFVVSWHADERCEERGVAAWQLVSGLEDAELLRERPGSKPLPSVVVKEVLADGSDVEVIWARMDQSRRAKLITVYFRD